MGQVFSERFVLFERCGPGGDGVSFFDSLPRQFCRGKNQTGGGHGSRSPPPVRVLTLQ